MTLTLDTLVVRRTDALYDEADGEITVMKLEDGSFYRLNGVATQILRAMSEPRRVAEIRDHLLRCYEVDVATCEAQLLALLDQMAADHLIDCRDEMAAPRADSQ